MRKSRLDTPGSNSQWVPAGLKRGCPSSSWVLHWGCALEPPEDLRETPIPKEHPEILIRLQGVQHGVSIVKMFPADFNVEDTTLATAGEAEGWALLAFYP